MLHRPPAGYTRYPAVFPSWDNTPRYRENSLAFLNASPGAFRRVLEAAIEEMQRTPLPEPLLFINDWNEWGEGCTLNRTKNTVFLG